MRLSRQFQASFFFFVVFFVFFLILNAQKRKSNQNQLTKQKQGRKKQQSQQVFARAKTSKRVKTIYFAFWCFLYAQNLFSKKKINWLEIVLITSFTILLYSSPKIHKCLFNVLRRQVISNSGTATEKRFRIRGFLP